MGPLPLVGRRRRRCLPAVPLLPCVGQSGPTSECCRASMQHTSHGRRGPAQEQPAKGHQGCAARQHAHRRRRLGAAGAGLQPVCAPRLNAGAQQGVVLSGGWVCECWCRVRCRCSSGMPSSLRWYPRFADAQQPSRPSPFLPAYHPPHPTRPHPRCPISSRPTTSASVTSGRPSARSM